MWAEAVTGAAKLSLHIRNVEALDNGVPTMLELDQRGAIIGRSPMVDWSLPDPRCFISSRHCEIEYRAGQYRLIDISTNGTFLNDGSDPVTQPRPLKDGDVILVGHYEIVATLSGHAPPPAAPPPSAAAGWGGWDAHGQGGSSAADSSGWDQPRSMPAISGRGAMSGNWSPPAPPADSRGPEPDRRDPSGWGAPPAAPQRGGASPSPAPTPGWGSAPQPPAPGWGPPSNDRFAAPDPGPQRAPSPSAWDQPTPTPDPASGWSSPAPDRPPPPSADDVWGRIAEGNVVDWARGGFGQPARPAPADPLGLASRPAEALPAAPPPAPPIATAGYARPSAEDGVMRFLAEAGLQQRDLKLGEGDTLAAAGGLIRRLVAGLVVMLEARARAKSQMGSQSTSLEFDGNNPLKFARTPEMALAQLLNPPERGFMPADRAVEDAFQDLQSHQMATLKAMQGALKATLDRFSPAAIRSRAEARGVMQRIMPGAHNAALWEAYEREFSGVAQGSDEAFMDVFAKEFRRAYDEQSARRPRR